MKKSLIFSFSLLGKVGFSTAIPLVFFALAGRFFDEKFGTAPYLFLAGLIVATVIVCFIIRKIVQQAIQNLNSESVNK